MISLTTYSDFIIGLKGDTDMYSIKKQILAYIYFVNFQFRHLMNAGIAYTFAETLKLKKLCLQEQKTMTFRW